MNLTLRDKAGYGFAGITDAANYNFMSSYVLFFLITIVNIDPAAAGTLTVAGTIVSAVWGPIVGFLSDHTRTGFGKRRPFLMMASLPLELSMILCFTDIRAGKAAQNIYYAVIIMVFWCSFATFYSPWLALGAEYTEDYDERTELRSVTYIITLIGVILGIAVPPIAVARFTGAGMSPAHAWRLMSVIIASIAFIAINITIISSAKKDICEPCGMTGETGRKIQHGEIKNLFKDYWEVLKLKPTKFVIGACFFHVTAMGVFYSDRTYFYTYNLSLPPVQFAIAMVSVPLFAILISVPVVKVSKILDKRTALIIFMLISSFGCMFLDKVIKITSLKGAVILNFIFAIGNSAFWQLMMVMIYDICEYDEFQNNKRREGIVVSIEVVMETVCAGIAAFFLGFILKFTGFDKTAAIQSGRALLGIKSAVTAVPAILMFLSTLMIYKYPITKKVFNEIKAAIAKRKGQ